MICEQELKDIITKQSSNIIFLVETDSNSINSDADYQIQGFKTIIQNKKDPSTPTRIICLVDEKLSHQIIIRMDLTSHNFASLWIEVENNFGKKYICGGFYREWTPLGDRTIKAQVTAMEIFTGIQTVPI